MNIQVKGPYGNLIWAGGLTLVTCASILGFIPAVAIVGMVIMIFGWILMLLGN